MNDGAGPSSIPKSPMEKVLPDFDLMDEILSGDFWPETPFYSENGHPSPFNSSTFIPLLGITNNNVQQVEEEKTDSETPEEQGLNWLIQPRSAAMSLKERLFHAVRFIKESQSGHDVLVQIWVPTKNEGKTYLSTSGQPFWLDENSDSLSIYRSVSTNYHFATEENSKEVVGLPGRVFLGKVPEWTPDVRYFRSDEYSRVNHAQRYNVCGTVALPVFEKDSKNCLGVVELVLTTQKVNYSSDLESICNALQAVDLRGSNALNPPEVKVINNSYKAALPEIQEVLKATCINHSLPLAQTWMKCTQQGKQGCRHSDKNIKDCVSTVDDACYVYDSTMMKFQEACSEYHLFKGQGVAGKAFTTNQPCFSSDITAYTKSEYPLSHHAKLFNLRAAVAICFRCIHTGNADFVLEFFLPVDCVGDEEQRSMLNLLSTTIQQVCKSLRVVSMEEMNEDATSYLFDDNGDETIVAVCNMPSYVPLEYNDEPSGGFGLNADWDFSAGSLCDPSSSAKKESVVSGSGSGSSSLRVGKAIEKRRSKSEKTVSLQVLRQYFAGSLKDAAKSLGVCPTTLKRICRSHGITRWPSRTIKKVGHSLEKLQGVMNSVQGADGTFQFSSVYENFAIVSSSHDKLLLDKNIDFQEPSNPNQRLQEGRASSHTSASNSHSSSSCSKSSNSSLNCPVQALQYADIKQEMARFESEVELNFSFLEQSRTLKNEKAVEQRSLKMFKVKAVYGEEKVRFRLQPDWGFQELKQETMNRFGISDPTSVELKYLDDDSEWVLLTCNDDLEECVEVYKSCCGDTIKILVHNVGQVIRGSSFRFSTL